MYKQSLKRVFDITKQTDRNNMNFNKINDRRKFQNFDDDPVERCIICGAETPYHFSTPIDERKYYVPGVGQICESCNFDIQAEYRK